MTGTMATSDTPVVAQQHQPAPEAVSLSQHANALFQPVENVAKAAAGTAVTSAGEVFPAMKSILAKAAGGAEEAMAFLGTGDKAQTLADDIQKNVDAALLNPKDQGALDALHRDSQQLNGNLDQNLQPTTNQALRDSVRADLGELEANGTLPEVTIAESGQISGSARLVQPEVIPRVDPSNKPQVAYGRMVLADPDQATKVWDF